MAPTDSTWKCGKCEAVTKDLEGHVRYCVRYFPFVCYLCDTHCPSEDAMGLHFRVKHPGSQKKIYENRQEEKEKEVERVMRESQPACQEEKSFLSCTSSTPMTSFETARTTLSSPAESAASIPSKTTTALIVKELGEYAVVTILENDIKNLEEEIDGLREKCNSLELVISLENRKRLEAFNRVLMGSKKKVWDKYGEKIRYLRTRRERLEKELQEKEIDLAAKNVLRNCAS